MIGARIMAAAIRRLSPADHRVMPWKNGLGSTTEIAVHPPGASVDEFTWRLSIADLTTSGPFSSFPGVERIIVQLEGSPMELTHEGHGRRRLARLAPHRFDGAWRTHAEIPSPARDFNVMARGLRSSLSVLQLDRGSSARIDAAAETQIVHARRGALAIEVGEERIDLGEAETLIVEGEAGIAIEAASEAIALVIAFAAR
jgi:environmental stress-induced protein Ves